MLGLPCRRGFRPAAVGGGAPWLRCGASAGGVVADRGLQSCWLLGSVVVASGLFGPGSVVLMNCQKYYSYLALSCLVTSRRGRRIPGITPVSPWPPRPQGSPEAGIFWCGYSNLLSGGEKSWVPSSCEGSAPAVLGGQGAFPVWPDLLTLILLGEG